MSTTEARPTEIGAIVEASNELQARVDAVARSGGGVCELPAGRWVLARPLELRAGVEVRGSAAGTRLSPMPARLSELAAEAGYGLQEVFVASPEWFPPGTGIHLTDNAAGGFYDTSAVVLGREGRRLLLDRPLCHDYLRRRNARAATIFPVVRGEAVESAGLVGVAIGGPARNPLPLSGCRGGGVFLLRCRGVNLRGVTVESYPGDAVSFQQCTDTVVEDCTLVGNRGSGLHPGSGTVRARMQRVTCHDNGGYGVFYCMRVQHTVLCDSLIEGNRSGGLSFGGQDTDNRVVRCGIRRNHGPGAAWRVHDVAMAAHNVRIEDSTFEANATDDGPAEVVVQGEVEDVQLSRCRVIASAGRAAVWIGEGVRRLVLEKNELTGEIAGAVGAVVPAPGCAASSHRTDPRDDRHLGRASSEVRHREE